MSLAMVIVLLISYFNVLTFLVFVSTRGPFEDAAGENFACYLPTGKFKCLVSILHLSYCLALFEYYFLDSIHHRKYDFLF